MANSRDTEDRFFRWLADSESGDAPAASAPTRLKSNIYSTLISRQEESGPLRNLCETTADRGLCVFERLVEISPLAEKTGSFNICRLCHARVLGERVENVSEHDGDDRHSRLHGEMKRAFLEMTETRCGPARSLGRDQDRASLAQRLNRRAHGFDRLRRVAAVDENHAGCCEEWAEDGVETHFGLADRRGVSPHQLDHQRAVESALVVEDEDRRPMGPKVLFAFDAKIDARERSREVAPHRSGHVDGIAVGSIQQADADPGARQKGRSRRNS